jgi:hypothetical protein
MATLRILAESDIPAVVALFARAYPGHRWNCATEWESYFRETLFDNPWRDPEVPSWVAEDGGRITGFYAVQPRRMLWKGRPIRVAAGCQFMVDPDRRHSLTALQMVQACIAGPQAQFCVRDEDTLYVLKLAYDERHARLAPGNMLLERVIACGFASGSFRHVSLVGDPPWFKDWRPQEAPVYTIELYNATPIGLMLLAGKRAKQGLRSMLRSP